MMNPDLSGLMKLLPLSYEDGPDYCTVKDAEGDSFALTVYPEIMKEMESALRRLASSDGGVKGEPEPVATSGVALLNKMWSQIYDKRPAGDPKDTYRELKAILSAPPADAGMREEVGWLIEMDDPPVYHRVTDDHDVHWTTDASKALRFARRDDAQAYSDHIGWTSPPVRIVEHLWTSGRAFEVIAISNGHHWIKAFNLTCCRDCGVVRRADDKNNTCKGIAKVGPRTALTAPGATTKSDGGDLCEGCPPVGYPTEKTRCSPCPRRTTKSDVEALAATTAERPGTVTSEPEPSTSDSARDDVPLGYERVTDGTTLPGDKFRYSLDNNGVTGKVIGHFRPIKPGLSDPSSTRSGRWVCAARQRGITLDPQDCDWPVCGCDPLANKVLDTIAESGFVIVPKDGAPMTDDQIKHMVDRFLMWQLPENFNPDAGISYTRPNWPESWPGPVGTNLFDAVQATAMVRHMLDGLPPSAVSSKGSSNG